MEYFLKWKGFPYSQNSWEPIDNLGCPELIEAFEESRQKELKEREGGTSDASEDKKKSKDKDDDKVGSFFRLLLLWLLYFYHLPNCSQIAVKKSKSKRKIEDHSDDESITSDKSSKTAKSDKSSSKKDAKSSKATKSSTTTTSTTATTTATATNDTNDAAAPKEAADDADDTSAPPVVTKSGFELGLTPFKILGASDASGELMFLMQWEKLDRAELVRAKEANVKCPQLVIAFYEERLTWHSEEEK